MKETYTVADLKNWSAETPPVRLGIFGDPVEHSLSPRMQDSALEHCGLEMRYGRFQIGADELPASLRLLPSLGFVGINLTVPHKVKGAALVDELDDFARRTGAINTVRVDGEKLFGFNTDGPGFSRAIRSEFSVDLRDLRVLLLGAGGGAGRALAMQCAAEGCERLVLVDRTREKAEKLAAELKHLFADARVAAPVPRLQVVAWEEHALRFQISNTDLLLNATSIGMKRSDPSPVPASVLAPHLMIYDIVYSRARTALLGAAEEAGARGTNGLSMLLHQGALAFEIWFEQEAPLATMRAALQEAPS